MKVGLLLHPDRGIDAVFAEAKAADQQGFDSVWVYDHLMDIGGKHPPNLPLDSYTLLTAIGGATTRVRLAWAMLNLSFRKPAVLAKMLSTLDQITKGRVIASVGAGWFKEEYEAYDVPLVDDHDERIQYARDAIMLMKQLWTHPAPERTTFEGKHVKAKNLPFSPAPYQKPHPPVWYGGDSDESLKIVKDLADGWAFLKSGNKKRLAEIMGAPDWPKNRPITVVKGVKCYIAPTQAEALADAEKVFKQGGRLMPPTFEEFKAAHLVGSADECLKQMAEMESWGINYLRFECITPAHQEMVAKQILPRVK